MAMKNVAYQIDAKHVLYNTYILEQIFKYIDDTDLPNVAQMCKLWRHTAIRENKKRYCIRQLRLPNRKIENLASKLDYTSPFASLLIYSSPLKESSSTREDLISSELHSWLGEVHPKGLEADLLEDAKNQLTNKIIVFEVDEFLTTESAEFQDTKEQSDHEQTDNCNILGIFFRNVDRRFRVDVSWVWCNEWTSWQLNSCSNIQAICDRVIGELGLKDCKYPKSAILMIGGHPDLLKELVKRAYLKYDIYIASGHLQMKKLVTNTTRTDLGTNQQSAAFLRISGPTVQSWSLSIVSSTIPRVIEVQLGVLQKNVYKKRKRHYIGFISGQNCGDPGCDHDEHLITGRDNMMSYVKRYFPDIPFTVLLKKKIYRELPDDVLNLFRCNPFDENDPCNRCISIQCIWFCTSIIIIGYD